MFGYKFTNNDMSGKNDFKFEIGETYSINPNTQINYGKNGFHFCKNFWDCFLYYNNIKGDKRLFLVKANGEIIKNMETFISQSITIVKEIKDIEKLIREYKHKELIDWGLISVSQKLSEEFIEDFKNELVLDLVIRNQNLSSDFANYLIAQHEKKINLYSEIKQKCIFNNNNNKCSNPKRKQYLRGFGCDIETCPLKLL